MKTIAPGKLQSVLRAMHDLAEGDGGVGYEQVAETTGIAREILISKAAHLKSRGLIERTNRDAPLNACAFFRVTAKGRAALFPEVDRAEPRETSVQRAIRVRPALATVWRTA